MPKKTEKKQITKKKTPAKKLSKKVVPKAKKANKEPAVKASINKKPQGYVRPSFPGRPYDDSISYKEKVLAGYGIDWQDPSSVLTKNEQIEEAFTQGILVEYPDGGPDTWFDSLVQMVGKDKVDSKNVKEKILCKEKPQTEAHKKALLVRLDAEIKNLPFLSNRKRLFRLGELEKGCTSHEPLVIPKPTVPEESKMSFEENLFNKSIRDGTLLKMMFTKPQILWGLHKHYIGDAIEFASLKIWKDRKNK